MLPAASTKSIILVIRSVRLSFVVVILVRMIVESLVLICVMKSRTKSALVVISIQFLVPLNLLTSNAVSGARQSFHAATDVMVSVHSAFRQEFTSRVSMKLLGYDSVVIPFRFPVRMSVIIILVEKCVPLVVLIGSVKVSVQKNA